VSLRSADPHSGSGDVAKGQDGQPRHAQPAETADGSWTFSAPELATVVLGLAVLAGVTFGTHILHRGFYYDDWDSLARTRFPGYGGGYFGGIRSTWASFGYRPALAVYLTTLWTVFDDHMAVHLAWIVVLAIGMSTVLYAVLRELAFPWLQAGAVAALVLVYPLSDSTRLWVTAGTGSLTTLLFLVGVLLSLRAFAEHDPIRARRLHIWGACFYLFSMLMAEVATVAIPAVFFLYVHRVGWRRAFRRSLIDTIVIAGPAYYIASNSKIPQAGSDLSTRISRVRVLFDQGLTAATRSLDPRLGFGRPFLLAVSLVVVVAAGAYYLRGPDARIRRDLRRWLLAIPAAFVLLAAAYAIYIPADPYYVPLQPGVGNRVNVLAAIGLVMLAAAVVVLAATLVSAALPPNRRSLAAGSIAGVALALIGFGYVDTVRADAGQYDRAFTTEQSVIDLVRGKLPPPQRHSTVYLVGAPIFEGPGVPIFAATWDFRGAVDVVYADRTILGDPILPGVKFVCGANRMYPSGNGFGPGNGARYGRSFLVNYRLQSVVALTSQQACVAASKTAIPGPYVVEDTAP
jgi:hypothetical protein